MLTGVLGFFYFDSTEKLNKLSKVLIISLFASSLFTFLGYAFGIGRVLEYTIFSEKLEEESVGLLGSSGLYSAAFIIGVFPFVISFINKKWMKWIGISLAVITFVFILLNVRRTAIAIPIIGLTIYTLYIPNKGKVISSLTAAGLLLLLLSPLYADKLFERFTYRQEQGRFEKDFYKTEGRYLETTIVFEEVFSLSDPFLLLFGERIFASGWKKGERLPRMLHSDVAVLLYGTGIIGFINYLLIYTKLFKIIPLKFSKNKVISHLIGSFYAVIFISILASLNGSLQLVSLRSLIFLFIGIIIRQYQIYKHNQIPIERTISYDNY
ncbi:MAG: hypothetical protein P1P88_18625 [Bacteroidales bacterium]|nr:hypothetical protein [Bacteroidales bacterium]